MKTLEFGNRGPTERTHDMIINVEIGRKYAYLTPESNGKMWCRSIRIPRAEAEKIMSYKDAKNAYFDRV